MPASTSKICSVCRLLLIMACVMLFASSVIYSASVVRYKFGGTSNSELAVTKLSLSHSLTRGKDGNLKLKSGNVTNEGASRPCPT